MSMRIRIVPQGNTGSKQKFQHCRALTGDADEVPCATTLPETNGKGKRTLIEDNGFVQIALLSER